MLTAVSVLLPASEFSGRVDSKGSVKVLLVDNDEADVF